MGVFLVKKGQERSGDYGPYGFCHFSDQPAGEGDLLVGGAQWEVLKGVAVGDGVTVEYKEKNGKKGVKSVSKASGPGEGAGGSSGVAATTSAMATTSSPQRGYAKTPEDRADMYTAYAKDLVVAGKTPEEAVKIIIGFSSQFKEFFRPRESVVVQTDERSPSPLQKNRLAGLMANIGIQHDDPMWAAYLRDRFGGKLTSPKADELIATLDDVCNGKLTMSSQGTTYEFRALSVAEQGVVDKIKATL